MDLRVLISSAGRRVGLIECFRRAAVELELKLEIFACDVNPGLSAACHIADRAFPVPPCDSPEFAEVICHVAREHRVALVVPTIDPELRPLAAAAATFRDVESRVHVCSLEVIDIVRDKLGTMRLLADAGLPVPRTVSLEEISLGVQSAGWPLLMKPRSGSASRGVRLVARPEDLATPVDEPMILQEFLDGPEFTVNLFIDQFGVLRAAVPHLRLRVRAGEVEKGRTERRKDLASLAERLVDALPPMRGVICFQVIDDRTRGPCVIEVNARFGGGYPLADYAGGCFAKWLLEEVAELPVTAHDDWRANVTMLRYDSAVFLD